MKAIRIILAILIFMVSRVGSGHGQAPSKGAASRKQTSAERFITMDDYRFHYKDQGTGAPTVVMDAGLCQGLDTWDDAPDKIAAFARVFVYDRVRLGGSYRIPAPGPRQSPRPPELRTSGQIVEELRALLRKAGVPAPYVLVGHSFGGLNVRLFASKYPKEVAGIVLIDSSNEEQYSRYAALMPEGARIGYERLNRGDNCESVNLEESAAQLREAPPLPYAPLVVLTAAGGGKVEKLLSHFEMQADLARRAPNSAHLVVQRSGHFIQRDRPDVVIKAIRDVVEQARPFPIPQPTEEDLRQTRILHVSIPSEAYVSGMALALSGLVGWRWRKRKRNRKQSAIAGLNRAERRQALRKEKREKSGHKTKTKT